MQSFTTNAAVGKQIVDKLYKVQTKNHQACIVLVHIEVQGNQESSFSRRLFEYCYKIYDRHQLPLITLVVLSDDHPKWRPKPFKMEIFEQCTLQHNFLSAKLLDWKGKEATLLDSTNPFENLIGIYLEARKTKNNPTVRLKSKMAIFNHLTDKGWERRYLKLLYLLRWRHAIAKRFRDTVS